MPIFLSGKRVCTGKDLFYECHKDKFLDYANALKSNPISYNEVPQKRKKIGSVDATSCIGVIYRTLDKTTYVHHHDGRSLQSLNDTLKEENFETLGPINTTLIGGCYYKLNSTLDYLNLEKHTKENIEQLVKFWNDSNFHIDLQGWVIGEGNSYQDLCSDFVADFETTYLLKQGNIGNLNLAVNGSIIPNYCRRLATVLLDSANYHFINPNNEKKLQLKSIIVNDQFYHFAKQIIQLDDYSILKGCSTTPDLEPPYFSKLIREMAGYVLSHDLTKYTEVLVQEEEAIFCIQGELIKS
jgi:hypothetical protein